MKKLIVANWKLNPRTLAAAGRLARRVAPAIRRSRFEVVLCPPAPYIAPLKAKFSGLNFGAQDAFYADHGAHTGAFGPALLKSVGARYVIVGHSERRAQFGEVDADVARKTAAVIAAGLVPIVCVGEPLKTRGKGMPAAQKFVARQLQECLAAASKTARIVIAYEPVWAISTSGSGRTETPQDAAVMIAFIKKLWPGRVLYGGSANPGNSKDLLAYKNIDGLLVGAASLRPDDFNIMLRNG